MSHQQFKFERSRVRRSIRASNPAFQLGGAIAVGVGVAGTMFVMNHRRQAFDEKTFKEGHKAAAREKKHAA